VTGLFVQFVFVTLYNIELFILFVHNIGNIAVEEEWPLSDSVINHWSEHQL